jgi:Lon protease-like protein
MRSKTFGWPVAFGAILCTAGSAAAQSDPVAAGTLPASIPIFPLQDVTLFPHSTQPFHIFEPRYRAMVADALASDSIIGMVMLEPGHDSEYEGRPPVHALGTAGFIVAAERLPDGRYDIVLTGVVKFRILGEDQSRAYRLAEVESIPEPVASSDRALLGRRRRQVEDAVRAVLPGAQLPPAEVSDEEVIDGLSLALPLEPSQRYQLLEAEGPLERASSLIGLLRPQSRADAAPRDLASRRMTVAR